jgi:hypothetical protein
MVGLCCTHRPVNLDHMQAYTREQANDDAIDRQSALSRVYEQSTSAERRGRSRCDLAAIALQVS